MPSGQSMADTDFGISQVPDDYGLTENVKPDLLLALHGNASPNLGQSHAVGSYRNLQSLAGSHIDRIGPPSKALMGENLKEMHEIFSDGNKGDSLMFSLDLGNMMPEDPTPTHAAIPEKKSQESSLLFEGTEKLGESSGLGFGGESSALYLEKSQANANPGVGQFDFNLEPSMYELDKSVGAGAGIDKSKMAYH